MAYGIVHQFPGGTQEQYEASIAAVHPSDGSLPEGQIFHAAGPSADGWTIIAIHDSQESWERFRDETLMPRMNEGIDGGLTHAPAGDELHRSQPADRLRRDAKGGTRRLTAHRPQERSRRVTLPHTGPGDHLRSRRGEVVDACQGAG